MSRLVCGSPVGIGTDGLRGGHLGTTGVVFFNDTATTEIYTLSLHDALPICAGETAAGDAAAGVLRHSLGANAVKRLQRSEEHTSELQSHSDLVCRLLLEKKKQNKKH